MTEPLLRDGLSDFGRGLFEAADDEAPSPAARDALLAAVVGTAAVTASLTTASASAAAAVKGGLATHVGASAASAGAGLATKGAAVLGAKLLVASAIGVATTAVVVGELRDQTHAPPALVATVASGAAPRPRLPVALSAPSAPEIAEPVPLEEPPPVEEPAIAAAEETPAPSNVRERPSVTQRSAPAEIDRAPVEPGVEPRRDDSSARPERECDAPSRIAASSLTAPGSVAPEPPPASASEPASASASPVAQSSSPNFPREGTSSNNTDAASLGAQIVAIDAARAELRSGNARGALATIEAFELRYGTRAPLSPEAMLVRVQAHLAMGNRRLAESTAAALIRDHASSVAARRATKLIGERD